MWGKVSMVSKLRWQGLGVEPPTFRSEVQRATTTPPHPHLFFMVAVNFQYSKFGRFFIVI